MSRHYQLNVWVWSISESFLCGCSQTVIYGAVDAELSIATDTYVHMMYHDDPLPSTNCIDPLSNTMGTTNA